MSEPKLEVPENFEFPYVPYAIQIKFMQSLYSTIENRNLGVFESPTGTGKSMSIICGSARWLFDAQKRDIDFINNEIKKLSLLLADEASNSTDWLGVHHLNAKARDTKIRLERKLLAIETACEKVKKIVENAQKIRKENLIIKKNTPRAFVKQNKKDDDLDLEEVQDEELVIKDALSSAVTSDSDEEDLIKEDNFDEKKYVCPKIIICSRTHSQLTQLAGEIYKSPYRELGVRVIPLASRQNMCINESVLRLKHLPLINEACQELRSKKCNPTTKISRMGEKLKKLKTGGGCPYTSVNQMDQLRGSCLSDVFDLEEMVAAGRTLSACPYYAARSCVEDAHILLVPYNNLLHRKTREASGIDLEGSVVIVDEAHNLLDTLSNIHSASVSGLQVCHSHSFFVQYRDRFLDRFTPANLLHLNQLIFVLQKLVRRVGATQKSGESTTVSLLSQFLIETEIDNINLFTLLQFAERSRLSQKLRGYINKFQPCVNIPENRKVKSDGMANFLQNISSKSKGLFVDEPSMSKSEDEKDIAAPTQASGNPVPVVLSFLSSLTNHCEDGRVVITNGKSVSESSLKFLLLNPAAHFMDVVKEARSVVLAGGTMQPFSEFTDQLFKLSGADPLRIHTFSCDHVVPASNIMPLAVSQGPGGRILDFSYGNRNNCELLEELGRLLVNASCVIPAGMVVFFCSYDYEDKVYRYFLEKGVIARIENKKKVLREPRQSNQVEKVLADYAAAASKGALLFSVIGGKLSEGLNFSDDLGRCVVVVGMPYPNKTSPTLKEKMVYLEEKIGGGAGALYYENLCMKAVNQSIGRSVRHINDYAAVLLLDQRYARPRVQAALPQWIRKCLQTHTTFRPVQAVIAKFFASKKTKN